MSLIKGNQYFRKGDYLFALKEYEKISKDNPLYDQAQFNIQYLNKIDKKEKPLVKNDVDKPLLSIVMPVFNVGPYLDASILSVLSQTVKDFELIIINDASTDDGKKIIQMYQLIDKRIKFVDLKFNTLGGAGIPSNVGIELASGEYIGFVDSDDWVNPEAFEKMLLAAEKFKAELVIADFNTFDQNSRDVSAAYDKKNWEGIPLETEINTEKYPQLYRLSPVPWRKLYRADFLKNHEICYPEGDYFYEDNPLHWFVLSAAKKVVLQDHIVSYHRMARAGQTMSSATYKLAALAQHLNTISDHLIQNYSKDQIKFDEFYDYCYRTDWVATRQEDVVTGNIIKKLFSKIYLKTQEALPPKNVRPNFKKKFDSFKDAYPDLDLTIIIPVFNCEDLINSTLDSVLKIKKIKFNIILMDDGSTDNTQKICEEYCTKHNNIHFYQQANKGAGRARNAVIPLCTGEYTYFLDADDVVSATDLENALQEAQKAKYDLHFIKYKIEFFEEKKSRDMFNADEKIWQEAIITKDNDKKIELASGLINYPWNRLIKTSLLHSENIFFGSTVVHNDIPFHWHSIISAKNIGFSNYSVCTHRKFTERNQITNISDARRLMVFEALRFTNSSIQHYCDYIKIKKTWSEFAKHIVVWAKDRVPETHMNDYEEMKSELFNNLEIEVKRNV